jgi:hypothetical protein
MQKSSYPICKQFLDLLLKQLYYSLQHMVIWREGLLERPKPFKITWCNSGLRAECLRASDLSLAFSWSETPGHMGVGIVQQDVAVSTFIGLYSSVCVHRLETFHSKVVVTWFEVQNTEPSLSLWPCLNRFTTSDAVFRLCRSVVRTGCSPIQMCCPAQVRESLLT